MNNDVEFEAYRVNYNALDIMSDDDIETCRAMIARIEQLIKDHHDNEEALFDAIWTLYHKSHALNRRIASNSPHHPFDVGGGLYVSAPPMGRLFPSPGGGAAAGFVDACR